MSIQKIALESLSMDLKRVSIGLQRGSLSMAERFAKEALKRKTELDSADFDPYIKNLLKNLDSLIKELKDQRKSEDILMYSTLFKNYSLKKLQ